MDAARPPDPTFPRVGRRGFGYHPRQVDAYLSRARAAYDPAGPDRTPLLSHEVRAACFAPVRNGYEPRSVDEALDLLEDSLARRERDHLITTEGKDAWLRSVGRTAAILRRRLHRPAGERFRRPRKGSTVGYRAEDVDELCGTVLRYLEGDGTLGVDDVRRAVFRPARGTDCYEEHQVDAFLDRVIALLVSVD